MPYASTAYNSLDKENCLGAPTSKCISYQGVVLKTLPQEAVTCRPSIDDIFVGLDGVLDKVVKSTDLSAINAQGMPGVPTSLFLLQNLKVYELLNLIIADNKRLRDEVATLKSNTTNILNTQVEIDLSCLDNPNCQNRTTYSLGEILQMLVTQACR